MRIIVTQWDTTMIMGTTSLIEPPPIPYTRQGLTSIDKRLHLR